MKAKTRHVNITVKFQDLKSLKNSLDRIYGHIYQHALDNFKTENYQYEIKTDESDLIDWREETINGELCWIIPSKMNLD